MALIRCITLAGLLAGAGVASGPFNACAVAPRAQTVADQAPAAGAASRAWLGVTLRTAPEALAAQLGLDREKVVVLDAVVESSPAQAAGLERLDLVLGARVRGGEEQPLAAVLRAAAPGDRITLRILRAGEERTVSATLGERPAGEETAGAPEARVDLEDGGVWSFGTGADGEAARRQAEEAMRQAQDAMRRAMEQAGHALGQQGWAEAFEAPEFEMPEFAMPEFAMPEFVMPEFGQFFDQEDFAREMQEFGERHAAAMERFEAEFSQRLEPAMKALEAHVERLMAIVSKEAHGALDGPLAQRLGEALEEADIDATADQVKDAARRLIDELGFNLNDGELSVSRGVEGIRRGLVKALEGAGVDSEGASLEAVATWLDRWSATISEEAAEALERLEAEFEPYSDAFESIAPHDAPAPPAPPAPAPNATPSLALPASGGKA